MPRPSAPSVASTGLCSTSADMHGMCRLPDRIAVGKLSSSCVSVRLLTRADTSDTGNSLTLCGIAKVSSC